MLCMCGCGQPTPLADRTCERRGWTKGQPRRFIQGHNSRMRTDSRSRDKVYLACNMCKQVLPTTEFSVRRGGTAYRSYCRACDSLRRKELLYTITVEEYTTLLNSQQNCCAICGLSFRTNKVHVDHDHRTGNVRGLLCSHCNQGLGHFRDNINSLQSAVNYLKKGRL